MKLKLVEFDGVAWDFDGTLTDAIHVHEESRYEVFARNGLGHISMEQHQLGPTYGTSPHTIIAGILKAAGAVPVDADPQTHPLVQKLVCEKRRLYAEAAATGLDAQPGAVKLVRSLGGVFVNRMAIVTTATLEEVLPFLHRYQLEEFFESERIITEETVYEKGMKLKPAPDAYLQAMKVLGIKDASRLLVFEDTMGGVEASVRAGATTLAVGTTYSQEKFYEASHQHRPKIFAASYADIEILA